MLKPTLLFAAMMSFLLLIGCESITSPMDDGYKFGDLSKTALQAQAKYCAEADPRQRALYLAVLKRTGAPIPDRGACTDLMELLPAVPMPDVNVDAAERDRERFSQ